MPNVNAAEVFPPGEFIQEELVARGWTQSDFATIIGRPIQAVNEFISGKRSITADTAREIGEAFGTSAQLWMNLETAWRLSQASAPDGAIARRAKLYAAAPVKELIRRQWVDHRDCDDVLERNVLSFMGMTSTDESPRFCAAARMSSSYSSLSSAQVAWLRQAQRMAQHVRASTFRKSEFTKAVPDIRDLAKQESDVSRISRFLSEIGVRLVVVEHLKGTKMDGAAFWLDEQSPVVALSMRFDRIDYLWHTLGHELGHIASGDGTAYYDEEDESSTKEQRPEEEVEADQFASELLVPREELDDFIARVRPLYSEKKIVGFADRIGVHPGVVVGQLHFREEIKYSHSRTLLVKVRQELVGSCMSDGWGQPAALGSTE